MTTDTSEKGLETLIMRHMTGTDGLAVVPNRVAERPPPYGGTGYTAGSAQDYDRAHALDVPQLFAFLRATQPEAFKKLAMADANDAKDINRLKFLARLSARSASAASSTCCARAWSTGRCTSTSSTARRRRATPRPRSCTPRTASRSRASSPTAWTRRAARSTCACSSTACPSPPSS